MNLPKTKTLSDFKTALSNIVHNDIYLYAIFYSIRNFIYLSALVIVLEWFKPIDVHIAVLHGFLIQYCLFIALAIYRFITLDTGVVNPSSTVGMTINNYLNQFYSYTIINGTIVLAMSYFLASERAITFFIDIFASTGNNLYFDVRYNITLVLVLWVLLSTARVIFHSTHNYTLVRSKVAEIRNKKVGTP